MNWLSARITFFIIAILSTSFCANSMQSVAIIGGGISGLSCAQFLRTSSKYVPTVFDTGRLRPGGRCSARLPTDATADTKDGILSSCVVDHATQVIRVPEGFTEFRAQVNEWVGGEVLAQFPPNSLSTLTANSNSNSKTHQPVEAEAYYGVGGMNALPASLSSGLNVVQDCWVSPSNGVKFNKRDGKWTVKAKGENLGTFDKLIIAHNGKCADRLMSKTPSKKLHKLLRVNFADRVSKEGGKRMTLNSIYSLTFVVGKGSELSEKFNGVACYIKGDKNLKFLSSNTRKHGREDDEKEVWTVLSSAQFGKKFKGPQENLPEDLARNVTSLLMGSLEEVFGLERKLEVEEQKLQLWGAGVPLNTWSGEGFLYDAENNVGCVGDWLVEPSVAGAWESGRRLAAFLEVGTEGNVGIDDGQGEWKFNEGANDNGIGDV
ncbi:hypothetical protein TrVE_jg7834 [Triparma verrucosa]|uniref:Uncharacterized protein n=1 Tax=Triparma verrucosa TaxID=1606542 RepID=A0A9W7C355_9STRA|nr:hypothetical protein TrVE_jg7834 [Triparma verrucosa]